MNKTDTAALVNPTLVWVDIPVNELDRAMNFYKSVLKANLEKGPEEMAFAVFEHSDSSMGGCFYESDEDKPLSQGGPLLYFNANGRLDEAALLAEKLGGKILKSKHAIGPHGFRVILLDTEGNRIALHSK
jgi:predicted enzyme related to lactoylglutathione lyase